MLLMIQIHTTRPLNPGQISTEELIVQQTSLTGKDLIQYSPCLKKLVDTSGKKVHKGLTELHTPHGACWHGKGPEQKSVRLLGTQEEHPCVVAWLSLYFCLNLLSRGSIVLAKQTNNV